MAFLITAHAFIDQQQPFGGQLCVVAVHDQTTEKTKYRIRFLPQGLFGNNLADDCREAARTGSRLPDSLGVALLEELGETANPYIPYNG